MGHSTKKLIPNIFSTTASPPLSCWIFKHRQAKKKERLKRPLCYSFHHLTPRLSTPPGPEPAPPQQQHQPPGRPLPPLCYSLPLLVLLNISDGGQDVLPMLGALSQHGSHHGCHVADGVGIGVGEVLTACLLTVTDGVDQLADHGIGDGGTIEGCFHLVSFRFLTYYGMDSKGPGGFVNHPGVVDQSGGLCTPFVARMPTVEVGPIFRAIFWHHGSHGVTVLALSLCQGFAVQFRHGFGLDPCGPSGFHCENRRGAGLTICQVVVHGFLTGQELTAGETSPAFNFRGKFPSGIMAAEPHRTFGACNFDHFRFLSDLLWNGV